MSHPSIAGDIFYGISLITLLGGSYLVLKARQPAQTIKNYKELADSQEKRINDLVDNDNEKTRQIAKLEGQVNVLRTLPLKDISKSMDTMATAMARMTKHITDHSTEVQDAKADIIKAIKGVAK